MSSLSSCLRALTRAQQIRGIHRNQFSPSLRIRTIEPSVRSSHCYSTVGYGNKSGDPISDNSQGQDPRPRVDTEHPGPDPVTEGQVKSGETGRQVPNEPKGTERERSPEAVTTDGKESGGDAAPRSGVAGANPTLSSKEEPDDVDEDVRKHNEEMKRRYGRKKEGEKDEKVDPKFWSGLGGREKNP